MYERALKLFQETCAAGYKNTKNNVSYKAVVDHENEGVYFHLQGTVEKEDVGVDAFFFPRPVMLNGQLLWVHSGFWKAFKEVLPKMREAYATARTLGYRLRFVGYSLGAALASFGSAKLGVPAVVFGCPGFMFNSNVEAKNLFALVTYIDAPDDVVTKIPLQRGSDVLVLKGTCSQPAFFPRWLWITGHSIPEYVQRMETTEE